MAEYDAKFNESSKYAMHLINTEEHKCEKFENGLWPFLKEGVACFEIQNSAKLLHQAQVVEKLHGGPIGSKD